MENSVITKAVFPPCPPRRLIEFDVDGVFSWLQGGAVGPLPHSLKILTIMHYVAVSKARIFVETGTLQGSTSRAIAEAFGIQVYTIENSDHYFNLAKKNFAGLSNVEIIKGDSGTELARLLQKIDEPAVFWLDAHFSGGETARNDDGVTTAINGETLALINHHVRNHVILIDDARHFGAPTHSHYPTIDAMKALARMYFRRSTFSVQNDIIRIVPAELAQAKARLSDYVMTAS